VLPGESDAQSAARIAIVPGNITSESARIDLKTVLPERLKDAFNRYQRVPFHAETLSNKEYKDCESVPIKKPSEKCPKPYNYYVIIDVTEKETGLNSVIRIFSDHGKELYKINAQDTTNSENPLVQEIMNKLIINLAKNIRIAIFPFVMGAGDKKKYGQLGQTLRSMLTEGLNLSTRLVLIDTFDDEVLRTYYKIVTDDRPLAFNQASLLQLGKKLHANYVITGQYSELSGVLRLDARCVNIETSEIVVSRGRTIDPIIFDNIQEKIAELAEDMREAIESDYMVRAQRPRYIAISGLPPVPYTKENRVTLSEIIRTTSRKLKKIEIDGFQIKEDIDKVNKYIEKKEHSRWLMSSELGIDLLFSFYLDRTERDDLVLTIDKFDTQNPQEYFSFTKSAAPGNIDKVLNDVIREFVEKEWIKSENLMEMEDIKYWGLESPLAFRLQAGPSYRLDSDLYLDVAGGIMVDIGLVWNPKPNSNWQVEPMHLRFDFLSSKSGGDKIVIGSDLILARILYRFRPQYKNDFYIGGSFGILGAIRKAGDISYNGRPGAGILMGWEHTMNNARKLNFRFEITSAFDTIPPIKLDEEQFNGGRPGGIYLSMGTEW
jgi:TolB-like protein